MTAMTLPITGRCLCQQVAYRIDQLPQRTGLCYCRSCQIKSGSQSIAYLACMADNVEIKGEVKWFTSIGDSGEDKQHGFCPSCGSNLFAKPNCWPHVLVVYAGSLDRPEQYHPAINLWLREAAAWAVIDHELRSFEKNPS